MNKVKSHEDGSHPTDLPFLTGTRLHWLDSGAHSLINAKVLKNWRRNEKLDYSFYKTPEFWKYVDDYATFIKKHSICIDYYANVDAIWNPEITWDVQKYLEEKHGLDPIPVLHYGASRKWVEKYLKAGYDYIALGGVAARSTAATYHHWADEVYNVICDTPDRKPLVRTHGFSITTHPILVRYPWWSVDSTTWIKMAYYGQILVPHKRGGVFDFVSEPYYRLFIDEVSPYTVRSTRLKAPKENGRGDRRLPKEMHFQNLNKASKAVVLEWLEEIGIPFGRLNKKGKVVEKGVSNDIIKRSAANVEYFTRLMAALPQWPWSFRYIPKAPSLLEV